MSDKNHRTEIESNIEMSGQQENFPQGLRRRREIRLVSGTIILAILYLIFWRYEWIRWTLVVTVPLCIYFLVSLIVARRIQQRKIEPVGGEVDQVPGVVGTQEIVRDDTSGALGEANDTHFPITRFTDRVDAYVRYRPGYPDLLIDEIRSVISMSDWSVVADIGSGTGLSSELFLRQGMTVYGVEPNEAMRRAGEEQLNRYDRFRSVDGTAEATTLADASVSLVAAGQAFHWFDRAGVKREWQRILKPDGHVLLFWNSRRTKSTPFLREYEELLHQYGTDYRAINHQNISDKDISEFFRPASPHRIELFNRQVFDFDGVRGRLESSSYAPAPGHPSYEPMIERLRQIVEDHGNDGVVTMEYDLVAWLGRISELGNS